MPRRVPSAGPPKKSQVVRSMPWRAPTDGWRTDIAQTDMPPESASTLVNWFPEPGFARVRNGYKLWANSMGGAAVQSLMPYSGLTQNLFAGANNAIYEITAGGAAVSKVTGLGSNYWSYAQTESAAGTFLTCVNTSLADVIHQFNGGAWYTPLFTSTEYPFTGTISMADLTKITGITSVTGLAVGMALMGNDLLNPVLPGVYGTYTITSITGPAPYTIQMNIAAAGPTSADSFYGSWPLNFSISGGIIPNAHLNQITGVVSVVGITTGMQIIDFNGNQFGPQTPLITPGTTITSITGSAPNYTIHLSAPASGATTLVPTNNGTMVSPSYTVYSGMAGLKTVATYGQRLWFLQQGSNNLFYSDTQAIAGELNFINSGADLRYGGQLVALCPWTAQTIQGVVRFLIVISSEGEVLVYQGTNPADDTNWSLLGAFKLSWPVGGDRCMFPIGGDVAIMTTDGVVAASKAIDLDPSASDQSAITSRITPTWLQVIRNVGQATSWWQFITHANSRMAIVNVPDPGGAYQFVMNTETLAWTKFTGWPTATQFISWNNALYMASTNGNVYLVDYGANDAGSAITATYCGPWQRITTPFPPIADGLSPKTITLISADLLHDSSATALVGASWNFVLTTPTGGASQLWGTSQSGISGEQAYRILGPGLGQGFIYAPTVVATVNNASAGVISDCHLLGGATYLEPGSGI